MDAVVISGCMIIDRGIILEADFCVRQTASDHVYPFELKTI